MKIKLTSLCALFLILSKLNAQQKIDKEFLFPNGSLTSTDGTVSLTNISYHGEHRNSGPIQDDLSIAPVVNTAAPNCTIYDRGVYHIAEGAGLVFNAGDSSNYQDYSISLLFKFNSPRFFYARIIDFSNGTKDDGIYRMNRYNLNFYPKGDVATGVFSGYDDKYVLLTLTRSKAGLINVYFNRKKIVTNYNDSAGIYKLHSSGNFIIIKDDNEVPEEHLASNVAYLRVTNTLLNDEEVIKIYDGICDKVNNTQPSHCYKPANTSGTALSTPVGITSLNSTENQWPTNKKGGWVSLDSKTKGFVPNRVAFDSTGKPVGITPANFVEGMMVYDTTNNCLKIYTSADGGTTFAWHCINTQTCPE